MSEAPTAGAAAVFVPGRYNMALPPPHQHRHHHAAAAAAAAANAALPSLRVRDCWWIIGALGLMYFCGIQIGLHMAHMAQYQHDDVLDDREKQVVMIRDSLEAWSSMWESYVEPIFETVYTNEYDDQGEEEKEDTTSDSSSLANAMAKLTGVFTAGVITGQQQQQQQHNSDREKKWEPEVPRFIAPETLHLPKPIINVGFPKAGTSSIFSFFHCNGLKGQHWFCCEDQSHPAATEHQRLMSRCILDNLNNNHRYQQQLNNNNDVSLSLSSSSSSSSRPEKRHILEGCGDYDFYSEINGPRMFQDHKFRNLNDDGMLDSRAHTKRDPRLILPQHHYLEELHAQFPNATLILNLRHTTQEWVDSVMRWPSTLRSEIPNEFWVQDQRRGFSTFSRDNNNEILMKQKYGIDLNRLPPKQLPHLNATLAYLMDYHSKYVRDFVRRHPSHTLIEVDITNPETGQILADAFGLNETCWGHRNENKKMSHKKNKSNQDGGILPGDFLEQTVNQKIMLRKKLAKLKRESFLKKRQAAARSGFGGMFQNLFSGLVGGGGGGDVDAPATPAEDASSNNDGEELPMDVRDFERLRGERIERIRGRPRGVPKATSTGSRGKLGTIPKGRWDGFGGEDEVQAMIGNHS